MEFLHGKFWTGKQEIIIIIIYYFTHAQGLFSSQAGS